MKKKFTTVQLFSIVDGRLSTTIAEVFDILNHVCDESLTTSQLPPAFDYIKMKNPKWFQEQKEKLKHIANNEFHIDEPKSVGFQSFINYIKKNCNEDIEIPQLKDELDTSDFEQFMIDHSIL